MAETSPLSPIPDGECRVSNIRERPVPKGYTKLIYAVHPSSVSGGDRNRVVQSAVQAQLGAATTDSRVILIAPPEGSVYLNPDTEVTDIRSDSSYYKWVQDGDISKNVQSLTLVGGNLERCLGAVFQGARGNLSYQSELAKLGGGKLTVELPLDAIYTQDGITAEAALRHLMQKASPLEAITALLTTSNPHTSSYGYDYGEFEIIASNGARGYEIVLNGNSVGKLQPHEEEPSPPTPDDDSGVTWVKVKPEHVAPTIALHLTGNTEKELPIDTQIAEKLERKIGHAKDVVLPQYEKS